jgi:hypothetical protein
MTTDYIKPEEVLALATSYTGDRSFRSGFTRGWYLSRLKDAVNDFGVATYLFHKAKDLKLNQKLQIDIPEGMYNISGVYVMNVTNGCCVPGSFRRVLWKKDFNNHRNPEDHPAKRDTGEAQTFFNYDYEFISDSDKGIFGNVQNNVLMLSPSASSYSHVRIIANHYGSDNGELPPVPRFMKEYIANYISLAFFRGKSAHEPRKYRALAMDQAQMLEMAERNARRAAVRSSKWIRESFHEYATSPNIK